MDFQEDLEIKYLEFKLGSLGVARFLVVGFYSPLKCDKKP
jgi:hypothetical protein